MSDDESERSGSPADPETRDSAASEDDSTPGDPVNAGAPTDPDEPATADDEDAPLSDLARRVSARRQESPDQTGAQPDSERPDPRGETVDTGQSDDGPPPDDDDPFDQMSVGEIDEETLWSSLDGDTESGPTVGMAGDAEPVSDADARSETVEYVVSKDTYCQSCPYLNEPPELACTHEGTEIVEVVDTDHFRVRNCPMVDE